MNDCECEKNMSLKYWPRKDDVGDDFLKKDNFNLIHDIYQNIKESEINTSAIFNLFYEEEMMNNLELDETSFDNFLMVKDENPMEESMVKDENPMEESMVEGNGSMIKPGTIKTDDDGVLLDEAEIYDEEDNSESPVPEEDEEDFLTVMEELK